MAVDGGQFHLTEHDHSAYRPADHSKTISMQVDSVVLALFTFRSVVPDRRMIAPRLRRHCLQWFK
jgi:hypothetical protein